MDSAAQSSSVAYELLFLQASGGGGELPAFILLYIARILHRTERHFMAIWSVRRYCRPPTFGYPADGKRMRSHRIDPVYVVKFAHLSGAMLSEMTVACGKSLRPRRLVTFAFVTMNSWEGIWVAGSHAYQRQAPLGITTIPWYADWMPRLLDNRLVVFVDFRLSEAMLSEMTVACDKSLYAATVTLRTCGLLS